MVALGRLTISTEIDQLRHGLLTPKGIIYFHPTSPSRHYTISLILYSVTPDKFENAQWFIVISLDNFSMSSCVLVTIMEWIHIYWPRDSFSSLMYGLLWGLYKLPCSSHIGIYLILMKNRYFTYRQLKSIYDVGAQGQYKTVFPKERTMARKPLFWQSCDGRTIHPYIFD